ncbi:hypothetical protein LJC58_07820 [Lachnospiraceae bacterium OttesenSCG-928-D06]|nr:hypothetical protein [Lachnospiraceae bacterium OttesenSCG-928-D06]
MKVLIGTTNPSKVKRFEQLLDGYNIEFITLHDLNITQEPEEEGNNPEENAEIKAKYYGQFFDKVICNDSGLYFDELSLEDLRQPGLNIRTPKGNHRLNDEEMISYYSELIHSLGGQVVAYYWDGIAVFNQGKIHTYMANAEEIKKNSSFYMIDTPSEQRHAGWPLDSISLNKNTRTYFVETGNENYTDTEEHIIVGEYQKELVIFLKNALGINVSK